MKIYSTSFILILLIRKSLSKIEAKIQGGEYANINQFPHSVFLTLNCKGKFMCGGSILNQYLVLTAGHCIEDCPKHNAKIVAYYGHHNIRSGKKVQGKTAILHENYDNLSLENDIGMIELRRAIKMGQTAKRVVIMGYKFPNSQRAWVAGWGIVSENGNPASRLKATYQDIQSRDTCDEALKRIPDGSFCAGPRRFHYSDYKEGAALQGDSGSALVVNGYTQIGLVSYKVAGYSYVVYTNVTYHYNWIKKTAKTVFCEG